MWNPRRGADAVWLQHSRGLVAVLDVMLIARGLLELVVNEVLGGEGVPAGGGVGHVEDQGEVQWVGADVEGLV